MFEKLVLRGVEEQFARQFFELPIAMDDVPQIRAVMTLAVPYFPPLVIYGLHVTESGGDAIEMIDITVDEEYWQLIGDDPVD